MAENLSSLIQEHHAFYEVSPYYVVVDCADGGLSTRRIQAGFDVDVYGESLKRELAIPGPDADYTLGYGELKKIAEELSHHATDSCTLEVIDFPATVFVDLRHRAKTDALLRIRISHYRGLHEPAGLPEERALEELEKELKRLGVARR